MCGHSVEMKTYVKLYNSNNYIQVYLKVPFLL